MWGIGGGTVLGKGAPRLVDLNLHMPEDRTASVMNLMNGLVSGDSAFGFCTRAHNLYSGHPT